MSRDEPIPKSIVSGAVNGRVLLVEDEYFIALQSEEWLAEAGLEVVGVAVTAYEAVRLAIENRPDFVLMDIRLAEGPDGIEAASNIYSQCGIRSLFVSAHSDEVTRVRAQSLEPLGWLAKPYTKRQFLEATMTARRQLSVK